MLKKLALLFVLCSLASPALAHDYWAQFQGIPAEGQKAEVLFGYGHNFPVGETIEAATFAERFLPPKVVGPSGNLKLDPGSQPWLFITADTLKAGTYVVLTESKESFSSRTSGGYARQSKKEATGVISCSYGASFGKEIVTLGPTKGKNYAKAYGQKLEIVPQIDPAALKVGVPFPIQVLYEGKALPGAEVVAYFAGFTPENTAYAFSSRSNKEGKVEVIPLATGEWLVKASYRGPYSDTTVCDNLSYNASLKFKVLQ
ncbi:MAG: DUF4198 domain-containing protein [Deltaproteobacteria bacterium]|jgi:uncharacterized GH25 family protein|nr:DUF4198 domain-containing protein [Deltaproteobacteria bacterium]